MEDNIGFDQRGTNELSGNHEEFNLDTLDECSNGTNELSGNHEEFNLDSPDECSNGCEHDHQTGDSFMPKGLNGGPSQVQSWHFMDNDFNNAVQDSMNSSQHIPEAFSNQEKVLPSPRHENTNPIHLEELQKYNHTKLRSLDHLGAVEDLHYKRTLSAILGGSSQLIKQPYSCDYDQKSSFVAWKKGHVDYYRPESQQKMLKKILFTVPYMYNGSSLKSPKKDLGKDCFENSKKVCIRYVEFEKSRANDNFLALKSMVPSITKVIFFDIFFF